MKAKLKVNMAQKVPIQFYFQQQGKKQKSDKDSETACAWERERGKQLRGEKCVYNCISVKLFNLLFVRARLMITTLNVFLAHKLCFLPARKYMCELKCENYCIYRRVLYLYLYR